jgi:hypothetical protein
MEKRNKQSAKGKTRDSKLVDALKSLYPSSTPITSILPVQTRFEVAGTSQSARSKGTKSPTSSQIPQKLLLKLTDPGKAPSAPIEPKAVVNPFVNVDGKIAQVTRALQKAKAQNDKTAVGIISQELQMLNNHRTSIANSKQGAAYSNYQTNLNAFLQAKNTYINSTLPDYNVALAQFKSGTATNTAKTEQYKKDIANFFSTARGGKTGSRRRTSTRKGSRATGSGKSGRSGSSRGSR